MDNFKEIIDKIPEEEREEFIYLCLDYRQAVWEQNQERLAGRTIPHHKFALHRAEYHNRIMDILRRILGNDTPHRDIVRELIMNYQFPIEIVLEWEEMRDLVRR